MASQAACSACLKREVEVATAGPTASTRDPASTVLKWVSRPATTAKVLSGFYRAESGHSKAIEKKDLSNAFAKHLNIFHPEAEGDKEAFNMKILQTFKKPLERKITEAVLINNSKANIKMNSKAEFHQPAVTRVITTREPPGQGPDHVGR